MPLAPRSIEMFRAVMRTGSVTQAAALLHTSQPTVSRELAALARELELPLFERRRGRLFPTAEAQIWFVEVERVYAGLARLEAAARALKRSGAGPLHVACLPALASTLVPHALVELRRTHPDAVVHVSAVDSPTLESMLTEQRADLGLIERSDAPPACELLPLFRADETCVLPRGHRLEHKRALSPADFAAEPFISFPESDPYRAQIDAVFAQHQVARVLGIETTSAASVCRMVQQGLGVSLVNPLSALEHSGPQLSVRPFQASIPFSIALAIPSERPRHALREAFVTALTRAARTLGQALRKVSRARPH